jgi:hypothetical protein
MESIFNIKKKEKYIIDYTFCIFTKVKLVPYD